MGFFDRLLSLFSGRNAEDTAEGTAGNAMRTASADGSFDEAADDARHPAVDDSPTTPNTLAMQGLQGSAQIPGFNESAEEWEELSPYLPLEPTDHTHVVAIATALAAADSPQTEFRLKRLAIANQEFQLVSCIAASLAAGALESSSFQVTRIYKKRVTEEPHAA